MKHENGGGGFIMLHSLPIEEESMTKWGDFWGIRESRIITGNLLSYVSYVASETKPLP